MVLDPIIWKFVKIDNSSLFKAYCKFYGSQDKFGQSVFTCTIEDVKRLIGPLHYRIWLYHMDEEIIVERQTNP